MEKNLIEFLLLAIVEDVLEEKKGSTRETWTPKGRDRWSAQYQKRKEVEKGKKLMINIQTTVLQKW